MPCRLAVLPAILGLVLAAAPEALAAGSYEAHDHATPGANWHVQVDVEPGNRRIGFVVLYVERCGRTTAYKQDVRVRRDGYFTAGGVGVSSWRVSGRLARRSVTGVFRLARDTCETGRTPFRATRGRAPDAPASGHDRGDHGHGHGGHGGHGGHAHGPAAGGGTHSAHTGGHPLGTYPDLSQATAEELAEAERLWLRTRFSANKRFRTYGASRRAGYRRNRGEPVGRPVLFHLNSAAKQRDGLVLDARAPESLVFWLGKDGPPVLIGFMFRAPAGAPPALGGPLLTWHAHFGRKGNLGATQMTHVWLTGDLRSALAGCLPVRELEAALPAFEFAPPFVEAGEESRPCE